MEDKKVVVLPTEDGYKSGHIEDSIPEPTIKVSEEEPELTEKQLEKQAKREKQYWNTLITRVEAHAMAMDMVKNAMEYQQDILRMLLIQNKSLAKALEVKDIITEDELNEL